MFLNCKFLWCWWNIINSYAWYWKGGIFTPFIIVCHKVDRNVMDAVNLSQIHPQGGGLLRCWNCALTSIPGQIWFQSIYRITGIIFVVSCEKLILLIRLFIKRYVICKRIIYIYIYLTRLVYCFWSTIVFPLIVCTDIISGLQRMFIKISYIP